MGAWMLVRGDLDGYDGGRMISLVMEVLIVIPVILGFLYMVVTTCVFIRDGGFWYDRCKHLRKCPFCGRPLFTSQRQCNDCGWVQIHKEDE